MSPGTVPKPTELESAAHALIGRLVFAFSREELEATLGEADVVAREFGRLRKRWPT